MKPFAFRLPPSAFLAAVCAAALVGCSSPRSALSIPPLPAWPTTSQPEKIPALRVAVESRLAFPGAHVSHADNTYTLVPHSWLVEYLEWTTRVAWLAGMKYTAESWDCDDFARGFDLMAGRAAAKAGVVAAPLIARVMVEDPKLGLHELNGVVTDRGRFIVEPQPGSAVRLIPLADYRGKIRGILWGDFNPF